MLTPYYLFLLLLSPYSPHFLPLPLPLATTTSIHTRTLPYPCLPILSFLLPVYLHPLFALPSPLFYLIQSYLASLLSYSPLPPPFSLSPYYSINPSIPPYPVSSCPSTSPHTPLNFPHPPSPPPPYPLPSYHPLSLSHHLFPISIPALVQLHLSSCFVCVWGGGGPSEDFSPYHPSSYFKPFYFSFFAF